MARNQRPTRELVSLSKAAEYAGVSTRTLRRRIADGSLVGYRMGPRVIRVDMSQVDELLHAIPTTGSNPPDAA